MTAITVTPPPSLASTRGRMCPRCGRFPASDGRCGEHGLFAVAPEAAAKKEIAPLLGQVVAERYILIDLLGDGGMASVYRAVDARLDRSVAVKVRTGLNALTDEDRARFESEARALSRLRSPNTVTVHDYGVAADMGLAGLAYIVMEQVEGEDLHARLARGALSPRAALAILQDVGRSLDEAHQSGIVHRDVKPANILLSRTPDGRDTAKVIDFGIARIDVRGQGRPTRDGVMMGTAQYMAPEQCRSGPAPIDARTDVYALACVAYEMLAGMPPFDGDEPIEVVMAQVKQAPPPLPGRRADPLRRALETIVHLALSKDPERRPDSVKAFVEGFAAALEGAPETAGVPLSAATAEAQRSVEAPRTVHVDEGVPRLAALTGSIGARRGRWAAAVAGLALGAGVVTMVLGPGRSAPSGADPADAAPVVLAVQSPARADAGPVGDARVAATVPADAGAADLGADDAADGDASSPAKTVIRRPRRPRRLKPAPLIEPLPMGNP